ncbi:MAG: cysteine desulfurase, partial [Thermoplasmata archaeon]|nr:cysteine desulfurase [Thermoplasmata archaeon]
MAHGHPLVYLDSAATSQKPTAVLEREAEFYRTSNANVHRGAYELSEEATALYEGARARVARFLHSDDPDEVVFVRGTTEAINLVAHGLGRGYLRKGDRVLTTVMEHHSNIVPWHLLRSEVGIDLEFVDIDDDGRLRMDDLEAKLANPTKVVALTHVSNVLGTVNPVRAIADRAHAAGALVVLDAAQSVPHRPVNVRDLGVDFAAFSGHKALGPTGIGVLWGRRELLEKLPPYMGGGEMIREVHQDRVTYRDPPGRFEAGTPNVCGAVALSTGLDYLEGLGWEEISAHERALARRTVETARDRFGEKIRFYGPPLGPD